MATERLQLAVIIVSWNVSEHLDRCLDSLRHAVNSDGVDARVWVIDNASRDATVETVRRRHPWVQLRPQTENLGYVRANNLGIAEAIEVADAIWLLNPDTLVPDNTIAALLGFMRAAPSAGLVGPKLLNPDGTLQECAFRFPGLSQAAFSLGSVPDRLYHTSLNGRYRPALFAQRNAFRIGHPLGAAMLARTKAIRDVGPLDEGFFMYCEEIDWAWRMQRAGWERWLVPDAVVTHAGGASTRQARPSTTAHLWESRARLYRKHRGRLTRALVAAMVRRSFGSRRASADSDAWRDAYDRILAAWAPGSLGRIQA